MGLGGGVLAVVGGLVALEEEEAVGSVAGGLVVVAGWAGEGWAGAAGLGLVAEVGWEAADLGEEEGSAEAGSAEEEGLAEVGSAVADLVVAAPGESSRP